MKKIRSLIVPDAKWEAQSSQRHWARKHFMLDKDGVRGLYKENPNTKSTNLYLKCISSADVFWTVIAVHESLLYAEQKKTWNKVKDQYYEIGKIKVDWILNYYLICAANLPNKSKAPLESIVVEHLFEHLQIDLVDMCKEGDDQWK